MRRPASRILPRLGFLANSHLTSLNYSCLLAVLHRWFLPDILCIFPVIMTAANLMNLCALPRFLL